MKQAMNTFLPWLFLIAILAVPSLMVSHQFLARRAIHDHFQKLGRRVIGISRFHGFLDFGSVAKAMTSSGYEVTFVSDDADPKSVLCLARRWPLVGYVFAIEVWEDS